MPIHCQKKLHRNHKLFIIISILSLAMGGCNSLRPVVALQAKDQSPLYVPPTLVLISTSTSTPDAANPQDAQPANCVNELAWMDDVTIPDGTFVSAGSILDKQWKVKNSGTCNWNETYSIRLIDGSDFGAISPQAVTPLRSGVEGLIRIEFTAPTQPGSYYSKWQVFSPDGQAFGDFISINFNVSD